MSIRVLSVCLSVAAVIGFVHCGGGSSPTTNPTPGPTIAPTPTPAPTVAPLVCDPTPPPLYGIKINVHINQGYRKTLDSKPQVVNVDGYCGVVGFDPRAKYCFTRFEDDPHRADCDRMAVGIAADTGRYGPQWYYEGAECAGGGDQPGCNNHPDNQFLVIAKGSGVFEACASHDVPIDQDRCGRCVVSETAGDCQ
jgi:hypothetical protein